MRHSSQFYLVSNNYSLSLLDEIKQFKKKKFERYTLFYHPHLPIVELKDGSLFLGHIFNVNMEDFCEPLNPNNFLASCNNVGGRWTYISNHFIFTDFLASKSIYYSNDCNIISSSLGLLRELKIVDNHTLTFNKLNKNFVAPSTQYMNIKQLLPGEYVDLKSQRLASHSSNYFNIKIRDENSSLQAMSQLMEKYTKSIESNIKEKGFYQGMTGGVDSRLTLSSFLMTGVQPSTITHSKPYFFMTKSDLKIPIILSNKFSFKHVITHRTKAQFDTNDFLQHIGHTTTNAVGSCLYYFTNGQMDLLKNKFFIDNYYELGAEWLYGIGETGKPNSISYKSLKKDGYKIHDSDIDYFINHVKSLGGGTIDERDVLYFLKNFSNVSQVFCELDYYMHPICHMNSRAFYSELLSTPKHLRKDKVYLTKLIAYNMPGLETISINQKDQIIKDVTFRAHRKIMRIIKNLIA